MTERELKAMYKNAALSEERMAQLEERFVEMAKRREKNSADGYAADTELMQYDYEIKPQPKKRSLRPIIGFCTAAAAVAAVCVGVSFAYKGGYLGTASSQTETSEQTEQTVQTSETTLDETAESERITRDMLPEYKNKGIYDVEAFFDETSFAEKAQQDIDNKSIGSAVVIGVFTISDSVESTFDSDTTYTLDAQAAYYQAFGVNVMTEPIKLRLYGNAYAQYDGCPPYSKGDMIVAALKYDESDSSVMTLAAEYALADVLTIDQNMYAAVRSSVMPAFNDENNLAAAEDLPLTYETTVSQNPARYYAIYELKTFADNLCYHFNECVDKTADIGEQSFDIGELSFSRDKAAMAIFEDYFYGEWARLNAYAAEESCFIFSYNYRDNAPYFGEIAEDEDAVYMLADAADNTQKVLCVMKNAPEILYVYEAKSGDILRGEYSQYYTLAQKLVPEEVSAGKITKFGLMNALTDYPEELYDSVFETLSGASAEYLDENWSRSSIFDSENIILNTLKADRLTITLKLTNESAPEYSRYFRAEFAKENDWAAKLTPASGDEVNMTEFFSPLESAENYPTEYTADDSEINVTYHTALRTDGKTDIYAFRDLGYAPAGESCNVCEIYVRDPYTDEYSLIDVGYAPSILVSGTEVYLYYTEYYFTGCDMAALYENGKAKGSVSIAADSLGRSYETELYISGEYLLIRRKLYTAQNAAEYKWIVAEKSLGSALIREYADKELTFTDAGFTTEKDRETIYWDNEGENLEGAVLMLTSRLQEIWFGFEISSPAEREAVEIDGRTVYEMQNEAFFTREGILNYFERALTEQAAESFYSDCLGHSIVEYDGTVYSTGGARGSNLAYGELSWEVTKSDPENGLYEITYTVYFSEYSDSAGEAAETYTLNAVKTSDGWRLDRAYMPY